MRSDQPFIPPKPGYPLADQVGSDYMQNTPLPSIFDRMNSPYNENCLPPLHDVDLRQSRVLPRNFIVFDRTDNRSQIMYYPSAAPNFCYPRSDFNAINFNHNVKGNGFEDERQISSSLKENSADIDALLSLGEDGEEDDDEEVSTARTYQDHGIDSAHSCPSKRRKSTFSTSSSQKLSSSSSNDCSVRKRQKLNKMVKSLRRIVPGGSRMTTVDILDEAVRYLKSLKVEVQKFGVGNSNNYS